MLDHATPAALAFLYADLMATKSDPVDPNKAQARIAIRRLLENLLGEEDAVEAICNAHAIYAATARTISGS